MFGFRPWAKIIVRFSDLSEANGFSALTGINGFQLSSRNKTCAYNEKLSLTICEATHSKRKGGSGGISLSYMCKNPDVAISNIDLGERSRKIRLLVRSASIHRRSNMSLSSRRPEVIRAPAERRVPLVPRLPRLGHLSHPSYSKAAR